MAFWYGKPDKETYREFAAFNFLKNLVESANKNHGFSIVDNQRLKSAIDMLSTQGYDIKLTVDNSPLNIFQSIFISKMRIHNLDTDEVCVFEFRRGDCND